MDINVSNLDLGYEQCHDLNVEAATSGENLLNNLAATINNLKSHWIASEATIHINNLIVVYEALVALITDAKGVTADASAKIIAIQEVRNANGGAGMVGDLLSNAAPASVSIGRLDPTSEYYVDPAAANDHAMLTDVCASYSSFVGRFNTIKDELFRNWTAGANRENVVGNFNEFEANSETYRKYLNDANDNLGIAVANINQL